MQTKSEMILCFLCGERPSVAYHSFFWDMIGSQKKAGFLCCGHCLNSDLRNQIYGHSPEELAAFQSFLDECLEESNGKFDIIPVGRTHEGIIGWFNTLKVEHGSTLH